MKNPAIQNVDYGIIQINKALKDLYACRESVNIEAQIRALQNELVVLQKQLKVLRKADFRSRNLNERLAEEHKDLAQVYRTLGPKSKAYKQVQNRILSLLEKI